MVAGMWLPCTHASAADLSAASTATLNPALVGFVPGVGNARSVAVAGSLAYVASEKFGLSVLDVSNPSTPRVVGASDVVFFGQGVAVAAGRAVVTGQTAAGLAHIWVFDLSNPTHPVFRGEISTTLTVSPSLPFQGVAINRTGTLAVTAMGSAGIWVVDLSNAAAPRVLGTSAITGLAYSVALNDPATMVYVAAGSGHLQIVDISNPFQPRLAGSLNISGTWQLDVNVAGTIVYLLNQNGSLEVVDVSNPASPTVIGSITIKLSFHLAASGSKLAIISGDSQHDYLSLVDVSTPSAPEMLGSQSIGPPGTGKGVAFSGSYVYVAANTQGVQIYDANGSVPVSSSVIDDTFVAQSVAANGAVAVVIGADTVSNTLLVKVLDVVNPASPTVVAGVATTLSPGNPSGAAFDNARALAVTAMGTGGLWVLDISNPAATTVLGTATIPGLAYAVALNEAGTTAYVAAGSGHLQIVDISNPRQPTVVGSLNLSGTWQVDVSVAGTVVYLLNQNGNLEVVDVSNPVSPTLIGNITIKPSFLPSGAQREQVGADFRGFAVRLSHAG